MMPYVVTVKRPHSMSRRAVATLEEARQAVAARIPTDASAWDLGSPESGGTVGPLPDGTVIEVERASWDDLVGPNGWGASTTEAEIVAAFNAQQEPSLRVQPATGERPGC